MAEKSKYCCCATVRRCVWFSLYAGWLTSCLGYLGITINDRMELEELFRYDVLVTCPPHFNLTFWLPNWSSRPDRTFDVMLDDAHSTYRVFVTTVTFHDNDHHDNLQSCDPDRPGDDVVGPPSILVVRWWSVVAVVVVVSVSLLAAFAHGYLDTTDHTARPAQASPAHLALTGSCLLDQPQSSPVSIELQVALAGSLDHTSRSQLPADERQVPLTRSRLSDHTQSSPANERQFALTGSGNERHLSEGERGRRRRRRLVVVVHVALRLVFALSCTFTACSMLFYASQRQRLDVVSQLPAIKRRFDLAVSAARQQLTKHVETGPMSDVAQVRQMQLACDG